MSLLIAEVFPARTLGIIAYGGSSCACAVRWWFGRRNRRGRPFGALTLVQLALLVDMIFDLRWKIHALLDQEAMNHGVYGGRRAPQLVALVVMVLVATFAAFVVAAKYRNRLGALLALSATIASVMIWGSEVISYHWMDALLYSSIGPFMAVSLVWLCFAVVSCVGTMIDCRDVAIR